MTYLYSRLWHSDSSAKYSHIVRETCLAANILDPLSQQRHRVQLHPVLYVYTPSCTDAGLCGNSAGTTTLATIDPENRLSMPAMIRCVKKLTVAASC